MTISVIIPAWNLWNFTRACLESLSASTPPGILEVIAVDNGSSDATVTELDALGRGLFGSSFRHVRLETNQGFAKACNIGAQQASGEYLFFLNNDATATAGWHEPLLKTFKSGKTGAAGPLLLYPDNTVQHCGIYFNPFSRMGHLYKSFPATHPLLKKKRPLQAITGAALMIPKNIFLGADGFCEEYVNGFEDMDLCFKLTSCGYKLAVAPESVFHHHTSQSPGRFDKDAENSGILNSRWGEYIRPDLHLLGYLDGYEMRIGEDLSTWLEISPQKAGELERAINKAGNHSAAIEETLVAEPLWPQGWQMLIAALEKEGNAQQAFGKGLQALNFFPASISIIRQLNELARQNTALKKLCADNGGNVFNLENTETNRPDATVIKGMLLTARRRARQCGDKLLGEILDRRLASA